MKQETINILYIDKHGIPHEQTITNDLESKQALVGGWIREIEIEGLSCIVNEEGYINDLEPTFAYEVVPNHWNFAYGPAFFVGVDYREGEYISLSDDQMIKAHFIIEKSRYILLRILERMDKENGQSV